MGIRQGHVPPGNTVGIVIKFPRLLVIFAFFSVIAGEKTIVERKIFIHDKRSVGIIEHIFFEVFFLFNNVVDHAAQESDVRTGTKRHMEITARGGPGVAGIDVNNLGSFFLGLCDPPEAHGVIFRHVASHDEDDIAVFHIDVVVRHGAATERFGQRSNGWAVADTGLMVHIDNTQSTRHDRDQPALLVVHIGTAIVADCFATVDEFALVICFDEIFVAGILDQPGHPGQSPLPVLFLPFIAARSAIKNLAQTMLVGFRHIEETGALGAKRSFINGMIGVAFNVDNFISTVINTANKTATAGTITACCYCLLCDLDPVHLVQFVRVCPRRIQIQP